MGIPTARNRPFPRAHPHAAIHPACPRQHHILWSAGTAAGFVRPAASQIQIGEVSPSDYQAPKTDSYISEVRTEDQRIAAENAVQPVYGSPDPAMARRQIERLRATLQYVTLVRLDPNSSLQQKKDDIAALSDVTLPSQTVDQILALTPARSGSHPTGGFKRLSRLCAAVSATRRWISPPFDPIAGQSFPG